MKDLAFPAARALASIRFSRAASHSNARKGIVQLNANLAQSLKEDETAAGGLSLRLSGGIEHDCNIA